MTEEEKRNISVNPFNQIIIKKDLHKLINELEIALKFTKKKKSKIKVYEQLVEQLNKM